MSNSIKIQDIVKSVVSTGSTVHTNTKQKIALVLDVSGSTGTPFFGGLTVLEKEIECMTLYILDNPDNSYVLYSFESSSYYHGPVKVLKEEGLVSLPDFRPLGGTSTHLSLNDICAKLGEFKPDSVKVYTDGQTNSSQQNFANIINTFTKNNIKFEVVAVATSNTNMETIAHSEEQRIPGMDLVNMLGNFIDSLSIFNLFHKDVAFSGIVNSSVDKGGLRFLGSKFTDPIHIFIDKLLQSVIVHGQAINWGAAQMDLKKALTEFGKLLSVFFVDLQFNNPLVTRIVTTMSQVSGMEIDRISKIIAYGFECSKQKKPILLTNFEGHIKDSVDKKNEFDDAITELNTKGTSLGSKKRISVPYGAKPVCVLDNGSVKLIGNLDTYPSSADQFGNVYFGLDSNPQAIRIAMRTHCGKLGFQQARFSNSVPFFVLSQMSMMWIKGIELNSEHMKALKELAIYQTSLEVVVAKNKYDGKGCYNHWKTGQLLAMHYEKPSLTHTSMYTDRLVNQLGLSEQLWWALMMSMLGLFEEQKLVYEQAVLALGIACNVDSFLNYVRNTYSPNVGGTIVCESFSEVKQSIFTYGDFEPNQEVFVLNNHSSPGSTSVNCCAGLWYEKIQELPYVMQHGCPLCHYRPTSTDFVKVVNKDPITTLTAAMTTASKLTITGIQQIASDSKKIRINMCGITGSGKSTASEKLQAVLVSYGYKVLIVSSDTVSKTGKKGKDLQNTIFNNIKTFENQTHKFKAVIMDLCNENGIQTMAFGWDFSDYVDVTFFPNFNKDQFDDYEAWCLSNIIARPKVTPNCNYYLNPVEATLATCIKVHNMKASGVAQQAGVARHSQIPNTGESQLHTLIDQKALRYSNYLKTRDFNKEIVQFLTEIDVVNLNVKPPVAGQTVIPTSGVQNMVLGSSTDTQAVSDTFTIPSKRGSKKKVIV